MVYETNPEVGFFDAPNGRQDPKLSNTAMGMNVCDVQEEDFAKFSERPIGDIQQGGRMPRPQPALRTLVSTVYFWQPKSASQMELHFLVDHHQSDLG